MNPYQVNSRPHRNHQQQEGISKAPRDAFREISWSESDVERSLISIGQNPDPVVRRKGLEIYQEMMKDDQVKACIELRKKAVLSVPFSIIPGDEEIPRAVEIAEFVAHVLDRLPGTFHDSLYQIYSSIEFGFSLTEKILEIIPEGRFKGKIGLKALKTREPFRYDFKTDEHGNILGLVYSGLSGSMRSVSGRMVAMPDGKGEPGTDANPFPTEKFVIYSYNSQFGNPYGKSDLIAAFRSWQIKSHVMKFWSIFLERYASPFIHAKVKAGAIVDQKVNDEIDKFLKNLSVRSGFRSSDEVTLEPVQAGSQTGADTYEKSVEAHNRFIAHAILMPNLLGYTQQPSTGSFALGKKHFDSFLWVLQAMGRDTEETIVGDQIIVPLVNLNYPGVSEEEMPVFKFQAIEEESIEARSRILSMLRHAGFIDPNEPWVREFLTLPKREEIEGQEGEEPVSVEEGDVEKEETTTTGESEEAEKREREEAHPKETFQERKETDFEAKVNVKLFAKKMDKAEEMLFEKAEEVMASIRDSVVAFVQRKKIVEDGKPKDVEEVERAVNVGELKELFRTWLSKIHLDSKLGQLEEIGRAGAEVEITKNFQSSGSAFEPWEPLPPREAIDFFNRKVKARITNGKGEKVLIEIATGKELAYYDEKAFAVAGVVRDDLLGDIKQTLLSGIRRQDPGGAMKDLKNLFNRYVQQGVAVEGELLEPSRLRTIVNTNIAEAVNNGRAAMMTDPDVGDFVQFFEYSAVMDQRTTDYCRCMDGKVFRIEDIHRLGPNAHYNCRSIAVPITKFELERMQEKGEGVEVADPCPGRMAGFADIKRDPVIVNPLGPGEGWMPPIPEPVKPVKSEPAKDIPSAPRKDADIEGTERLKQELAQIISRCPYPGCGSPKIRMTGRKLNVGEFVCDNCYLPFRISNKGDLYHYDAGTEKWERVSIGLFPKFFKEK